MKIELRQYTTPAGKRPFESWFNGLYDQKTQARIITRLYRVSRGNLGDCKPLGGGLFELRMMFGSGYRVYFGREGERVVLLLCGGDKKTQGKDIEKAKAYWADYQEKQDG